VFLPLAVFYLMIVATASYIMDRMGIGFGVTYALVLFAINLVIAGVLFWGLDRGRILSGTETFAEPGRKVA